MIKAIKKFVERQRIKKAKLRIAKLSEIRVAVTEYYAALDAANGGINIPPFVRACKAMTECIKTEKDLNRVYKSLQVYKKTKAVA